MKIYPKRKIVILLGVIIFCFALIAWFAYEVFPVGSLILVLICAYLILIIYKVITNISIEINNSVLSLALPKRFRVAAFTSFSISDMIHFKIPTNEISSISLGVIKNHTPTSYELTIKNMRNETYVFDLSSFDNKKVASFFKEKVPMVFSS